MHQFLKAALLLTVVLMGSLFSNAQAMQLGCTWLFPPLFERDHL
jgi:hypothetical protein